MAASPSQRGIRDERSPSSPAMYVCGSCSLFKADSASAPPPSLYESHNKRQLVCQSIYVLPKSKADDTRPPFLTTEVPAGFPEVESPVAVGRRAARTPPPRCPCAPPPSSLCGHSCGGGQWRGLQRLTAARVATTSAVVAAIVAEQLPWAAR